MPIVLFAVPCSPPSGSPPASLLAATLRELAAILVALWQLAPNEALSWRVMSAVEVLPPLLDHDQELTALPTGDLAELRLRLAQAYTVLHWDARERRWWPVLAAALAALLDDLDREVGVLRAVA